LQGTKCNRDAIGAVVQLKLGDRVLTRTLMPTRSYLSQCEKAVTFGLGDETSVGEITVKWPGGDEESFAVDGVDRSLLLTEGP
jgi:hypothetical protein